MTKVLARPEGAARAPRGPIWQLLDSRGIGGIESHVATLAEALQSAGCTTEIVFVTDHGDHPLAERARANSIHVRALSGGLRGVIRGVQSYRPQLVHTHGYKAGILGRVAAKLSGTPVVSTFHSGGPESHRVRIYNAIDRSTSRLAHTIAVSPTIAKRLPATPIVIENFVQLSSARKPAKNPAIGFVGRLTPEKGPDHFRDLARRFPSKLFHVYGDGPLMDSLSASSPANVRYIGAVPTMDPYWPDIDLLCITSKWEGLPMAALEAMAHGIGVIAYDVGGLSKVVIPGETGWLVPPGDQDAFVRAIDAWMKQGDEQRERVRTRTTKFIAENYSSEQGARRIIAVYLRALGVECSLNDTTCVDGNVR